MTLVTSHKVSFTGTLGFGELYKNVFNIVEIDDNEGGGWKIFGITCNVDTWLRFTVMSLY